MPLPITVSCFRKIQVGFTILVPARLGSPGQRAVKCLRVLDAGAVEFHRRTASNFLRFFDAIPEKSAYLNAVLFFIHYNEVLTLNCSMVKKWERLPPTNCNQIGLVVT